MFTRLLLSSVCFSLAPCICLSADNTASIEQLGAGSVTVSQSGSANTATIEQKSMELPNTNPLNSTADYQHKILSSPLTSSYARAKYLTDSDNRPALTKEPGDTPGGGKEPLKSSNRIRIYQSGKDNTAMTSQTGSSNNLYIEQLGKDNSITKVQNGEHNQSRLIVNGNEIENTDSNK